MLRPFQLTSFDYDQELETIWRRFDFDPLVEEGVRNEVGDKFETLKAAALQNKTDFAFETNYHHDVVLDTVRKFAAAGHMLYLIYVALPNEEAAIRRVKLRVSQGGHSVDEATIRDRFRRGLALLDCSFHLFDRVAIIFSRNRAVEPLIHIQPKNGFFVEYASNSLGLLPVPRLNDFVRFNKNLKQF